MTATLILAFASEWIGRLQQNTKNLLKNNHINNWKKHTLRGFVGVPPIKKKKVRFGTRGFIIRNKHTNNLIIDTKIDIK